VAFPHVATQASDLALAVVQVMSAGAVGLQAAAVPSDAASWLSASASWSSWQLCEQLLHPCQPVAACQLP